MSAPAPPGVPSGPSGGKKGKVKKKVAKKKTTKDEKDDKAKKEESATDEPGSGKEDGGGTPKPGSAGSSVRDAALRVLMLSLKSEWTAVEGVIKSLEKAVEKAGDEIKLQPLAAIVDPVRVFKFVIFNYDFNKYIKTINIF